MGGRGGGVNLRKCNKLFIVAHNCFRMAISLELIKINSIYFYFFHFFPFIFLYQYGLSENA